MASYLHDEMELFNVDEELTAWLNDENEEDLQNFADIYKEPKEDEEMELYIYTSFLICKKTLSTEHLEHAILLAEGWVAGLASDHPDRTRRLQILDFASSWMAQLQSVLESPEMVLAWLDKQIMASGNSNTDESTMDEIDSQIKKAAHLAALYEQTNRLDELEEAIHITKRTIDVIPRPLALNNLATMFQLLYKHNNSLDDLNLAIDIGNDLSKDESLTSTLKVDCLSNLSDCLGLRSERTSNTDDLAQAIQAIEMAIDLRHPYHESQAINLNRLGTLLARRSKRHGSGEDIDRAIDVAKTSVEAMSEDKHKQAIALVNLAQHFGSRFEKTLSKQDLNNAVEAAEKAYTYMPNDTHCLNSLSLQLGKRSEQMGSMDDLNRAIEMGEAASSAIPPDSVDRYIVLSNLSGWLERRSERTGSLDDLTYAINAMSEALNSMPQGHYNRGHTQGNLGLLLGRRFERTGLMSDTDRAIEVVEEAAKSIPEDHPDLANVYNTLGYVLQIRFQKTQLIDDLNRAIEVSRRAVDITSNGHHRQAARLSTLGNLLRLRFEKLRSVRDLKDAIEIADESVKRAPSDNPSRADYLLNLGNKLKMMSRFQGSTDYASRALSAFLDGWSCGNARPSIRIRLAQEAAQILALRSSWGESSKLLQAAVELLPSVSPRSLDNTDKQHMLKEFTGLASMAAAASLNAGMDACQALRLLELGRSVIAGLLLEMRGDISDLQQEHPIFAREFISLRNELDSPINSVLSGPISEILSRPSMRQRRAEAEDQFRELLGKIRDEKDFQNFLLPPKEKEIMGAATVDPIVVINSSVHRCDAFIVERDQIRVLKLPDLTIRGIRKQIQDIQMSFATGSSHVNSVLEWLWRTISLPILEALNINSPVTDDKWPRVWWIPTGILSQLPLHAAGYHSPGSTNTVLDRTMSSYASSIKSLIFGRRSPLLGKGRIPSDHALLIAMHKTPHFAESKDLPSADTEVEIVNQLCTSLHLKPIQATRRKIEVLECLRSCRVFHFAGHGLVDHIDPSKSGLLLEDWKTDLLTVGDLRELAFQDNPPFLGYLSACSTGVNKAEELADEGVHLISAFQLAGFRHVIGTLWEVSDRHCVEVARVLYETIRDEGMTDLAVCRGLHHGIRSLRNGWRRQGQESRDAHLNLDALTRKHISTYWVPYIHFGV